MSATTNAASQITGADPLRHLLQLPHPYLRRHSELLDEPRSGRGPRDDWSIEQILALFPTLPVWPGPQYDHRDQLEQLKGARTVLGWLAGHPGAGWQQRWIAASCDEGAGWIDELLATDPRVCARLELRAGLSMLLLCRVVLPSYTFLADYQPYNLYLDVQQVHRPQVFARLRAGGPELGLDRRQLDGGLRLLAKLVLHTGREVDQLAAEDIQAYRAWSIRESRRSKTGIHASWTLLRQVVDLGEHATLREALRFGQRPTAELVDRYRIQCRPVRGLLIRYLDERRPAMDHGSFLALVTVLVRNFWVDIEHHHPGIDTLRLPDEVAEAWKLRMAVVSKHGEAGRIRKNKLDVLMRVRAFYLDLAEWAVEDPATWAPWAVPSPVRPADLAGMGKQRHQTTAAMHQRVRERLPHLPVLADTAAQHAAGQAAFLHAAEATGDGDVFEHDGRRWRRTTFRPTGAEVAHRPHPTWSSRTSTPATDAT